MNSAPRWLSWARIVFLVIAVTLGIRSITADWSGFVSALDQIGLWNSAAAFGLVLLGLLTSAVVWRLTVESVVGRLERSEARRTFFHTQLGKYLPGGVWTLAAQVDRSRSLGVQQSRMGIGAVMFVMLHLVTGAIVVLLTTPWSAIDIQADYPWVPWLAPLFLVFLAPRVIAFLTNLALRAMGRNPLDGTWRIRDLVLPTALMAVVWLAYGGALWVLIEPLATSTDPLPLLGLALGTFALAWVVGVLVILAPAGIGAREAVILVALTPLIGEGAAASVALLLRVLQTGGDLLLAAWFGRTTESSEAEVH